MGLMICLLNILFILTQVYALYMYIVQNDMIVAHRYVPNGFCIGTIVVLVKDKSGNLNDNYRRIWPTLIPAISKLFEHVILSLCEDYLLSDELQFGFKRDLSCCDAIFMLRTAVGSFNSRCFSGIFRYEKSI